MQPGKANFVTHVKIKDQRASAFKKKKNELD